MDWGITQANVSQSSQECEDESEGNGETDDEAKQPKLLQVKLFNK